jgi:hypothetical protein
MVTEGNRLVWLIARGMVVAWFVDIAVSGTFPAAVTLLVPFG